MIWHVFLTSQVISFRNRTWKSEFWSNCCTCWILEIVFLPFCQGVLDKCCPKFVDKNHATLLHHLLCANEDAQVLLTSFPEFWIRLIMFDIWRMHKRYYDVLSWMHRSMSFKLNVRHQLVHNGNYPTGCRFWHVKPSSPGSPHPLLCEPDCKTKEP